MQEWFSHSCTIERSLARSKEIGYAINRNDLHYPQIFELEN